VIKRLLFSFISHLPLSVGRICGRVGTLLQNVYSVLFFYRSAFKSTTRFHERTALWRNAFDTVGREQEIIVLEFGVWKGESIKTFAELNHHPQTIFVGFDSFEGLPEEWMSNFKSMEKGFFSTGGDAPRGVEPRIQFKKGWFEETLPQFLEDNDLTHKPVLVHFDADLYSSTLFVLSRLWGKLDSFYFIFDEWTGGEALALMNFQQAYGGDFTFYGHAAGKSGIPSQVFGKATLKKRDSEPVKGEARTKQSPIAFQH
jgi:O-methyltransferase